MALDDRLLSGVSVLAAVVEAGSFVRAAETLGITQPAVSRAIARLEARIGVRLLDRTTRSVTLTEDGRRLYEETSTLLSSIGDAVTLATIKRIHDATGRIIDPHTAVAAAAAARLTTPGPKVILSTAHPAKFTDAVTRAIGHAPPVPPALAALQKMPEKLSEMPNKLPLLRQFISSRLAE